MVIAILLFEYSFSDHALDQADLIAPDLLLMFGEKNCQMNEVQLAALYQNGVPDAARHNERPPFGPESSVLDKSNLLPVDHLNPRSNIDLGLMAIFFLIRCNLEFPPYVPYFGVNYISQKRGLAAILTDSIARVASGSLL